MWLEFAAINYFRLMSEFEISVRYKGEDLAVPAKVHQYGYTYKIEVEISGSKIFFQCPRRRRKR